MRAKRATKEKPKPVTIDAAQFKTLLKEALLEALTEHSAPRPAPQGVAMTAPPPDTEAKPWRGIPHLPWIKSMATTQTSGL